MSSCNGNSCADCSHLFAVVNCLKKTDFSDKSTDYSTEMLL